MNTIEVLDKNTIDKIAAGEVVERPASVVKELLENAIDAGAGAITVEIREGGKSVIRITDNGSGIPAGQVDLAFTRHATSKIRNIGDLIQIRSLGFRGEALSSIAAVSQVEMITKTPDSLVGTHCCIEGGVRTLTEEIGAPQGTTIIVRNLFYNTPARAKFLKSASAEGSRAAAVVEEIALSHPDISFKFLMNGQNRLFTSGNGNLKEIIHQIFGKEIGRSLIPVEYRGKLISISGFIGSPEIARGNRGFENYFVNGRFVKSRVLSRAIEDAYHGHLMQHRYPFTLLYFDLNGDRVDVNVHPSKMEVRISGEEDVYREIILALQNTLMERERIPEIHLGKEMPGKKQETELPHLKQSIPEPFEKRRREAKENTPSGGLPGFRGGEADPVRIAGILKQEEKKQEGKGGREEKSRNSSSEAGALRESGSYGTAPEQTGLFDGKMLSADVRERHRMIGQIFGTYWLIEFEDALYIVDQHAAHEKVLYERLMKQYREKSVNSQILYPAPVVTLTIREQEILQKNIDSFRALGYEAEPFGGRSYQITSVPDNLYRVDPGALFREILDGLADNGGTGERMILERIASMSCKAAVKGNRVMSVAEADALIDELLQLEDPYHCPHGRPTIVKMTHYELDRKFRRIV